MIMAPMIQEAEEKATRYLTDLGMADDEQIEDLDSGENNEDDDDEGNVDNEEQEPPPAQIPPA